MSDGRRPPETTTTAPPVQLPSLSPFLFISPCTGEDEREEEDRWSSLSPVACSPLRWARRRRGERPLCPVFAPEGVMLFFAPEWVDSFFRRLGLPMRVGSRGMARPRWRRFFAGEHEPSGESFLCP